MRIRVSLAPISVGAPFTGSFAWTVSGPVPPALAPLPAGVRVYGQFELSPGSGVLLTADTVAGTLTAPANQKLQFNLTAAQTLLLAPAADQGYAMIDFFRYDAPGAPILLPFRIRWPVLAQNTVPA